MNLLFKNFFSTLRRYKAASLLNIVGLSVAFAAFAIIMMQVRYDLTYDRSQPEHERIFRVELQWVDGNYFSSSSLPMIELMGSSFPQVEAVGGIYTNQSTEKFKSELAATDYPFTLERREVTAGLSEVFDFDWVAGDDSQFAEPNAIVIPQSGAERMFPGRQAVGQYIVGERADTVQLRIVGVYRDFPQNSTLRNVLYAHRAPNADDRMWGSLQYISFVRLRDPAEAPQLAGLIAEAIEETQVDFMPDITLRLSSLRDIHYLTDLSFDEVEKINRSRTWLFLLIAVLIVVIAMINFVNFSIALVPARLRSVNTQKVFGCATATIRWMIWFEAVGVCLIALLVAIWLVAVVATTSLTELLVAPVGWRENLPLLFGVAGAALAAGTFAGLYPAFYTTSFPTAMALKGSMGLNPRGKRLRQLLISFQYLISMALIVVALFIHVQSNYLKTMPIGFDRQNLLQMRIAPSLSPRSEALRERLLQHPNIREVAFANSPIVSQMVSRYSTDFNDSQITFDLRVVSENYARTLGLQIVDGRDFTADDLLREKADLLFNQTAREQYGLKTGDRIRGRGEIVGFFSDINYKPLYTGVEAMALEIRTNDSRDRFSMAFLRVDGADIRSTIDYVGQIAREMAPEYTDGEVVFVDQGIGELYEKEDKLALLITLFSALAILISLIGVFGLVLFETQYRRKEIGIRKVHGATIGEVLRLLNSGFVRIVLICFVLAAPIAYYFVRKWLEGFAYRTPVHWWVFAIALLVVLLLTLLTVTLQSYRAATENPVNSIKTE